jgi:hypothetical protein
MSHAHGDLIPLPDLPAALLAFANQTDPLEVARCGYLAVWRRARGGSFPVQKMGRSLMVERSRVEEIARDVLRLTGQPRSVASKPGRTRSAKRAYPSNDAAVAA